MNLPRGKDRAVSIGLLAESYGLSRRRVERDLEELVLSGLPIVACSAGVYVSDSPSEVRAYTDSLYGRISAVQGRISALRRAADAMEDEGQTTLGFAA